MTLSPDVHAPDRTRGTDGPRWERARKAMARRQYRRVLRLLRHARVEDVEAAVMETTALMHLGRVEEAQVVCEAALRRARDPFLLFLSGLIAVLLGDPERGEDALVEAVEAEPQIALEVRLHPLLVAVRRRPRLTRLLDPPRRVG